MSDKFLPLLDTEFLKQLDSQLDREIMAKVIALDFNENPVEEITGQITGGSISIDGASSVRRTCSLNLTVQNLNIYNYYWGLTSKISVFIGMKNNVNPKYDDIIWFPQGVFILTAFNINKNINNYTISLTAKDKMCLLNGDIGGNVMLKAVDFGSEDIISADQERYNQKLLLKDIILEMVHEYAKEPYYNIIVNDLDDMGVEMLEYRSDIPMYLLLNTETDEVSIMSLTGEEEYALQSNPNITMALKDIPIYNHRNSIGNIENFIDPTIIIDDNNNSYTVIKAEYGDVIGYRATDLVYAGDLIAKIGDTITSVLDRIINMLGDFEYFYNVEGQFVFQRKKTYVNVSWNSQRTAEIDYKIQSVDESNYAPRKYWILDTASHFIVCVDEEFNPNQTYYERIYNEAYIDNAATTSSATYSFENSVLISAFSNTPDLSGIKNDFALWGERAISSDVSIPIHIRYAIDRKPISYRTYDGTTYTVQSEEDIEDERLKQIYKERDQKIDSIQQKLDEAEYLLHHYPKKPNPEGLSDDWWEVLDWAHYFNIISQAPMTERLGYYAKESIKGSDIDLNAIFPIPSNSADRYGSRGVWDFSGNLNVFSVNADGTLGYFGHRAGCSHTYDYFIQEAANGGTSYVYRPTLPTIELQHFYDEIEEEKKKAEDEVIKIKMDSFVFNCDWREVIYQMARDYFRYSHDRDFLSMVAKNNPTLYPNGYTGYEQYYTDMEYFWRQIYNPDYEHDYIPVSPEEVDYTQNPSDFWFFTQCKDNEVFDSKNKYFIVNRDGDFVYEPRLVAEMYKQQPGLYWTLHQGAASIPFDEDQYYYAIDDYESFDPLTGWSYTVLNTPEDLVFWFDFADIGGELGKYSVHLIGDRTYAVEDSNISAIYFQETPTVIFLDDDIPDSEKQKQKELKTGYTFIQLPEAIMNLFTISARKKSAMDELDSAIYQHAYCAEGVSLTTLPIYHLQPNTRIFVYDEDSHINGEYIITRLNINLDYKSTMTIGATKAVERIY